MTQEYVVVIQLRDKSTKDFQLYAPTRDDAVGYIKRLTRNTFKKLVSARKVTPRVIPME